MNSTTRRVSALAVALLLAIGLGSYAVASGKPSRADKIVACARNSDGQLQLVEAGTSCAGGQTKVIWNRRGQRGDVGATGPTGPAGAVGAAGPMGVPGPAAVSTLQLVRTTTTVANNLGGEINLSCPTGKVFVSAALAVYDDTNTARVTPNRLDWAVEPQTVGGAGAPNSAVVQYENQSGSTRTLRATLTCL